MIPDSAWFNENLIFENWALKNQWLLLLSILSIINAIYYSTIVCVSVSVFLNYQVQ